MVLEEGVVKVEDDDFFPFSKLRVYVTNCGHGGRYVLDMLVDGIEVYDQSAIVFCKLVKGFVSGPSFSGQEGWTHGLYLDPVLLWDS